MKTKTRLLKRLFKTIGLFLFFGMSIILNGQTPTITGISGSGAAATGLSASWEVQWATSSQNAAIRVLYVTYENQTNNSTKMIFDALNTGTNGWQIQFGSTNSGAWKDFCAANPSVQTTSSSVPSVTESFQLRYNGSTTGTVTNTIYIGFGSGCSAGQYTQYASLDLTVTAVSTGLYTWTGMSNLISGATVDSFYTNKDNWEPTRTTPSTDDVLVVDLAGNGTNMTTIDISGVTDTIDQFIIYGGNQVNYRCSTNSTANWVIGKSTSTAGDDFIGQANTFLRKTGSGNLNIEIRSGNTMNFKGDIITTDGSLTFNGAGTHSWQGDITTTGGTLNLKPLSGTNTFNWNGTAQTLSGTGGTLYIDSNMNLNVGNGTSACTLTLSRSLPLYSKLTLASNTVINSNTTTATGASWWAYEPHLQLKWFNKQGSTAHGQIAAIPSTSSITGNMLFELLNSTRRSYRAYGLPIKNGFNLSQFTDDIVLTGTVTDNANKDSFNQTCSYCKSSVFTWDESSQAFSALSSGATANKINLGQGILVFYRGTIDNGLGDTSVAANSQIIDFVGAPHQGDFSYNLVQSSGSSTALQGLNLVGNPYPCTIDLRELYENNRQDIYPKFYFYDAIAKTFNTWDSSSQGNPQRNGTSDFKDNNSNKLLRAKKLSPGASVFVFSKGNNKALDFTESMKDPTNRALNRHFNGPAEEITENCGELSIYMNYNNDTSDEADGTTLLFDLDDMFVTNDADPMDAVKMYAGFLGVGTVTDDGSWLCIDRRKKLANPGESYSVPLKVSYPKETPTDIRLYFGLCESGNEGYDIQLVDKLNKTTTTINNNSEYLYSINTTAEKKSDRFEIVFTGKELMNNTNDIQNKVAVYPNPAEDKLNILTPTGFTLSNIEITNIDGKILKTVSPSKKSNLQTIDISEIPSGVYIIQISTQSGIVSKKLLKN